MKSTNRLLLLSAAAFSTVGLGGCDRDHGDPTAGAPSQLRMTWFGITNWHYQVGELGIVLDGAVGFPSQEPDSAMVARVNDALSIEGDIDVVLLGHLHGDHSVDTPEWAIQTGAQLYASEDACDEAVSYGLAADRCTPIYGGETFELDPFVTMGVVRWVHSVPCGEFANGGGIETFGYLFAAETPDGPLTWYVTDSGAGGRDLMTDQVSGGINHGAPLSNLENTVRNLGVDGFELWQAGPESRVVDQARTVVPMFNVRYLMPHHYGARGGFDLLGGLHYPYDEDEMPELKQLLESSAVSQVYSTNYFDAFLYDSTGIRPVRNAMTKATMGLPPSGPGPAVQGTNPRAGQLECPGD